MTLTRQHLTPLEGYDDQVDWSRVMERTNQRLIRWVLGTGLLSLHLTVFSMVLLAMYTWNLIKDPTDLHLLSPFRIWGVAALAHTLLVGGGLIGWRIFNMSAAEAPTPVPMYPRRSTPSPRPESSGWSQAWARSVGSAARVNAGARRWAAATTQRTPEAQRQPSATGWPAQPGAKAPVSKASATEVRVDVGEATWPEAPPISTSLLGASEARAAADHVVSVDHRANQIADDDPGRTWVDSFVESRSKDKENRWSWVEAAAASWLSRRELSGKAEKALPASSESTAAAATPVDPERPDETSASQ